MHNDITTTIAPLTTRLTCLSTQRIDSESQSCELRRLFGRYSRIEKEHEFSYNPSQNS